MSNKKKRIPEIRFPEFKSEGDWESKMLGEVLRFQTGFPFESAGFNEEQNGIRLIRNRDLKSEDKIIYYSKSFDVKFIVRNGDILVGMDGDFTPCVWNKDEALLNQRVGRIKVNKKNNDRFFFYLLTIQLKIVEDKTAKTTVKHLSHSDVEKIFALVPSLNEQNKIASCLSSLDNLIETQAQKVNFLKDHKKGLMQNLFPREGEKVPRYRFSEFKNDINWTKKTVGDIYDFKVTNSFAREFLNYEDGSVKNIHYGDIHTKFSTLFDISKEKVPFVNSDVSIEKIRKESYCNVGDVIFADASEDMDGVGKSIEIVNLNKEKLISGLHTLLARQKEKKFATGFGGYLFKSDWIRKQIKREAQGAKVLGISATRISNVQILYPESQKEQQKIAMCLSSLDDLIREHAEKLEQLKQHKKGLMQGLFPKTIY